jgi:hypothetical protein
VPVISLGTGEGAGSDSEDMPTLIGGLAALMALAAGILAQVEPVACTTRAALAFLLGWVGTQVWYVFFTVRIQRGSPNEEDPGSAQEPPAKAA